MTNDNDISLLSQREHVRIRPSQFLGSIIPETSIIPYNDNGKFNTKEITYTPACIRCINEILENSCDEFLRSKIKKPILNIIFDEDTKKITISDNGTGIPIGTHTSGLPTPQVVVCYLGSGSNFKANKEVGMQGQNGVGAACVNFCSKEFTVSVARDKQIYNQTFINGTEIITTPIITTQSSKPYITGTTISFILDEDIFPVIIPTFWLNVKAQEIANTIPNLTVFLTVITRGNQNQYEYSYSQSTRFIHEKTHSLISENCNITIITDTAKYGNYAWVNGGYLFDGGSCIQHLEQIFINKVTEYIEPIVKKEKLKFTKEDILQNIIFLTNLLVSDPLYDSQAKTRFKGPSQKKTLEECFCFIDKFFKLHPTYIDSVLETIRSKTNNKAKKQIEKKNKLHFIEGYLKATSTDRTLTWLLLNEGLSAASQVSAARDPKYIGSLPLGGKMNNVYDRTPSQLLAMPKIVDLMQIIGLVPGKKAIRTELNYYHVVIATDADPDGDGIFVNLVNVFYSQWPELFEDKETPFLYRLNAPNIVAVTSKDRIHFKNRQDYEQNKHKIKSKFHIEYMKGLGSMTISDWKKCLENKNSLEPVIADDSFSNWLDIFFSKDVKRRKEWLTNPNNNETNVIEKAYRNFSLYTLEDRALLYLQDGLRASIRRSLWLAKDASKQKTLSLSGSVAKLHPHGDVAEVIQNFTSVFKNNIAYFNGNDAGFGTLLSPSQYSAPRYTSVDVADFTRDVILKDLELVPMKNNYDETTIEPEILLPLIPLHFLNPTSGIATGFKCETLPYDLKDIIDAQICILDNKPFPDMVPYFKPLNQHGTFSKITDNGNKCWIFNGTVEKISTFKWRVTSLPFGLVHSKFIQNMYELYTKGIVTNIDDSSSDHIDCVISFSRTMELSLDNVIDVLGLQNSIAECLYFIDFTNKSVRHFTIESAFYEFTHHRLSFYPKRLQLQNEQLLKELSFYHELVKTIDIITEHGLQIQHTKKDIENLLLNNGVVDNLDRIISLPLYRFNKDEKEKCLCIIDQKNALVNYNTSIICDEKSLRKLYKKELMDIKKRYC